MFSNIGHDAVEVRQSGRGKRHNQPIRVKQSRAISLWMQHTHRPTLDNARSGRYVVLSFVVRDEPDVVHVCVSETDEQPPPWPNEWSNVSCPSWVPILVGEWVPVHPACTTDECQSLVNDRLHHREQTLEHDITQRCAAISQHGDDTEFTESLDFYTTLRVKHAYLRMNADGLNGRYREFQA